MYTLKVTALCLQAIVAADISTYTDLKELQYFVAFTFSDATLQYS